MTKHGSGSESCILGEDMAGSHTLGGIGSADQTGNAKLLETLFPGPRRHLLCAIYGEPKRWWSLKDLAQRSGTHLAPLRRPLREMREGGLLCQKREQGRTWFRSNPECPVAAELQSLVNKLAVRSHGGETILVVEDQPATAQITRILLESWGYTVLEAHGAEQAIDVFEHRNGEIDLLLTDVIMPGRSGAELAAELWRRRPDLRVVFMSGYPSHELSRTDAAFLAKPFTPASLSKMIRTQLEGAEPAKPGSLQSRV